MADSAKKKKIWPKIMIILAIIIVLSTGVYLANRSFNFLPGLSSRAKIAIDSLLNRAKKEINAPPGLRKGGENAQAYLTRPGVIKWTNVQRANNGLGPLYENDKLDQDAILKMNDMFQKQYFEHVSPQGQGPSYWADQVGYAYVVLGENLALGDFDNDQALVDAWMASPGHRANILNNKYTEIGVAVGKGNFQGHETWIAVQAFGEPLSTCPQPDPNLKAQIDSEKSELAQLQSQITSLQSQIQNSSPGTDPLYNQKVDQYNGLVSQYNNLLAESKSLINEYNNQVNQLNVCIKS